MEDKIESPLVLYRRRWAFLTGLFLLQMLSGISFTSFGQVSNFYVQFFRVDHLLVDWITNARNVGAVPLTLPIAWLIFKGHVRLRNLIVIVSFSSTAGLLLVAVSLCNYKLFTMIIIGQVLCGMSEMIAIAIPPAFAALWFPDSQVGTAISLTSAGLALGDTIGYLLPPMLLYRTQYRNVSYFDQLNNKNNYSNNNSSYYSSSNRSALYLTHAEVEYGRVNLMIMYGVSAALSAFVAFSFLAYVTDRPPTPATKAQALKVEGKVSTKHDLTFLEQLRELFLNRSFVLLCVVVAITFQLVMLDNLLMPQIIAQLPLRGLKTMWPDVTSSYVMCQFSVGLIVGSLIGGKVVDRCKRYKVLVIIGMVLVLLATITVALGVLLQNAAALFSGNFLYGVFLSFCGVVIYEISTQLTFPIDEAFVNVFVTSSSTTGGLLLGTVGRFVYEASGASGVLALQNTCIVLAVVLLCFLSSRNLRLEAENGAKTPGSVGDDETARLLPT